jgi:hypothetical protein
MVIAQEVFANVMQEMKMEANICGLFTILSADSSTAMAIVLPRSHTLAHGSPNFSHISVISDVGSFLKENS